MYRELWVYKVTENIDKMNRCVDEDISLERYVVKLPLVKGY